MNTQLDTVLCVDPVVDVQESYKPKEVVYKAGTNKSIFKYTADSYSNQSLIWNNITPPSLSTVVKRDLRVAYSILVLNTWTTVGNQPQVFNAVNTAGAPQTIGTNTTFQVVPRSAPLQEASSSIELRLNGSATSVSINDYACIYPHIMTDADKARYSAEMPLQKDNSAVYDPLLAVNGTANAYNDSRSPFAPYGINTTVPTRASYTWTRLNATAIPAGDLSYNVYQLNIVEELFVSPAVWGELMDKVSGWALINNLTLNIRIADVNRMLSAVLGASNNLYVSLTNTVTNNNGITVTGGADFQAPTLLVEYITQDPILAAKMPAQLVYDYSQIVPFISPAGSWVNTSTDNQQFTAQSLRLSSIPSKLYIFCRPSKSALNTGALAQGTPSTFLRIKNLSVNFDNRINLFATYTEADLYNMSVKNGLQDSFNDWKYQTGSIAIIDINKDVGLDAQSAAGQSNQYSTLQVTATLSASPLAYAGADSALAYDFYILVDTPGKTFINASECQYILTGASPAEVLKLTSDMDSKVDHTELEGGAVGGSAFGKVGNLLRSGAKAFKNINPASVASAVSGAQQALSSLGLGVAGGSVAGGAMKHRRVY